MTQILLVEDNRDLAFGLMNNLQIEGYQVDVCHDGNDGLNTATTGKYDLIILDVMLPFRDGFDVLQSLRKQGLNMPVLMLTAKGEELDKVRGLRLGADDYLTKPFGLMELLARVEALLRRSSLQTESEPGPVRIGDVEVYLESRRVLLNGKNVELTPKEFDLLATLIRYQGQVLSRTQLLKEVWHHPGRIITRTIDTHIGELRRKLEQNPAKPRYIKTVRKTGYRLDL